MFYGYCQQFRCSEFFFNYHFPKRNNDNKTNEDERSDSIWAIIGGFVKQFNVSFDYALHKVSYANLILYSSIFPDYNSKSENKKENNTEIIDADDPRNAEKVNKILLDS